MYIYYVDLLQDSEMNGCLVHGLLCSILLVDVFNMHGKLRTFPNFKGICFCLKDLCNFSMAYGILMK